MRRVWVDGRDPSKELFEGIWDLTVFAGNSHSRGRYGMDQDGENTGRLFWAVRHSDAAAAKDVSDDEGESCFY